MNTKNVNKAALDFLQELSGESLSIATLLKTIRECDELSQVQMAKKLGVSRQRLCDIENGRSRVSPKLAKEFAEKLGYGVEQFVRFSLQDILDRDHLNMVVDVKLAA